MVDSHTTPRDATPNAAPVTLQRNRRVRRLHNARTDVVERTRWVPFAPTDSLSPALTVQETPVPEAVEVRVVSYVGKRYAMRIASLIQNYRLAPEDVEIVERTPRHSAPVEPLAVLPPAVVAEVPQGQLALPQVEVAGRLDVQAPVDEPIATSPEDMGVRVFVFRDRPCVIAAAVGKALGYADEGKGLAEVLRKQWVGEVIEGKDFAVLAGAELRDFKALPDVSEEPSVSRKSPSLTILYESGWDLVCIKTEKPEGVRLRRRLADEVLPKLRRGEAVLPAATEARFARLEAAVSVTADELRAHRSEMSTMVRAVTALADTVRQALPAAPAPAAPAPAAPTPDPGPRPEQEVKQFPAGWRTRAQFRAIIAAKLGEDVSEQRVGNALQALAMKDRGKEVAVYKLVEQYQNGAHFHVPAWAYHPAITEELAGWVRANPVRRRRAS